MASQPDTDVVQEFAEAVGPAIEDEQISLSRAALIIARTEYPSLDFARYLERLDELARRVQAEAEGHGHEQLIRAVNLVLYQQEGFHGNRDDYYDPRNSFLNDVLERKTGIPITLALVYMEVARRSGLRLCGVGMPGHFLLKHYAPEGTELLIDAFDRGRLLSAADCQRRLNEVYAGQLTFKPEFLNPVNKRQMLTRMLNNLRHIYLTGRNFRKALAIVDLVLAIYPRSAQDVKQRGLLRYSLGQLRGAIEDLNEYLRMSPEASDADEVRNTALTLGRTLASLN